MVPEKMLAWGVLSAHLVWVSPRLCGSGLGVGNSGSAYPHLRRGAKWTRGALCRAITSVRVSSLNHMSVGAFLAGVRGLKRGHPDTADEGAGEARRALAETSWAPLTILDTDNPYFHPAT